MEGHAPVLKVFFSATPSFVGGTHMMAASNNNYHIQLIRGLGKLTPDATEIIGWLQVFTAKPPLMIPNFIYLGVACTMYIFDLQRHDNKTVLKRINNVKQQLRDEFITALGLADETQLPEFLTRL